MSIYDNGYGSETVTMMLVDSQSCIKRDCIRFLLILRENWYGILVYGVISAIYMSFIVHECLNLSKGIHV